MADNYESFANQYLNVQKRSGDEWMAVCVYHDETNASMRFNVRTGLHICFSCGEGGSIKKLASHFGVRRIEDVEPSLRDIRKMLDDLKRDTDTRDKPPMVRQESYLKRFAFPTDYWQGRGFTQHTIDTFELGYDALVDAVTIPLRNTHGDLLGVTKRYLDPDADSKYKYPPAKWFERSKHLFASWLIERNDEDTLALVEGSVDSMMVWQAGYPSCAQYGSSLSLAQIRLLRRLGIGHIVLFFDNDLAGNKAADRALGQITYSTKYKGQVVQRTKYDPAYDLRRDFLVDRVMWATNDPKDPGELTGKQILRKIRQAKSCL